MYQRSILLTVCLFTFACVSVVPSEDNEDTIIVDTEENTMSDQFISDVTADASIMSPEIVSDECIEELCDGLDNDCDGYVDEIVCSCMMNDASCYGGPPSTRNVGICQDGMRECDIRGEAWLTCSGWQDPQEEICDMLDNDCDGQIDEGTMNACGACGDTLQETCDMVDNDCDGQVDENLLNACGSCGDIPMEICDGMDNDCDGTVDEGVTNACGSCGEISDEICDAFDNDCDGQVDEGVTNACGSCGEISDEICDRLDNDCDGTVDETVLNACGVCGDLPVESCDGVDNDCDGTVDENVTNACGMCGDVPVESCDGVDNDCDGQVDEGVLNACGECGDAPVEICDLIDNDCDRTVDEGACVEQELDLDGDCLTVSCPPEAPHPIACNINFDGGDPRGCVAHRSGQSEVYLQEGNACGAGRITGRLICSSLMLDGLNEDTCPINKRERFYPNRPRGCPETDD